MVKRFLPSPRPNEISAGLPFCSAISKTTGERCRARAIGAAALAKHGLLDHENAGRFCLFHLKGPLQMGRAGGLKKHELRKAKAAVVADDKSRDKSEPGETVWTSTEVDPYGDPLSEPEPPPPPDYHAVDVGRNFMLLTPDQRRTVLRAAEQRARGGS